MTTPVVRTPPAPARLGRLLLGAALAAVVVTSGVLPAAAARPGPPDAARLTAYLESALRDTRLPGVAAAVVRGDRTVFVGGVGRDGRGSTVTPHTRFFVGSLSKAFTAVAVLQLVQAGRVRLDAPVQAQLPGFTTSDAGAAARVTVRHLLNQTSGLADASFPQVADDDAEDLATRVADLRAAHLVDEPGARFRYSDLNYQVLGRLVEVVTGMPLGGHLREQVFGPLGMDRTVSVTTAADGARLDGLARGHVLLYGRALPRDELDGLLAGSGGVVTTAADMARWLAFQTSGRTSSGELLLRPDLLDLTHRPPAGGGSYAMGWQVTHRSGNGPARLEHTGVLSTSSAQQVLLPDTGDAFALLYNGNSAPADTAGVADGVAALLTGSEPSAVRDTRLTAGLLAAATLAVLVAGTRGLLRASRWAARRRARSGWGTAIRLVPTLIPAVLLLLLPGVLRAAIGRSFTVWQLTLAAPDVVVLLVATALAGLAVSAGRAGALIRARAGARSTPRASRGPREPGRSNAPGP
ncbi:serine hydrolase domain-containing protein [Geodermatophilus sabuli]|uniref:CubicO group peptidase, beta-lactamase class C family n=1 Tax=Geodermatophilus sabuli TaxID=1564158 RepID=A0A285EHQ4_9ACTN|nr:serine hydrolase domain-containing protein [Geodermatophilus sabuli]MBB3084011.1 CubicO group peptidase (beta-lactamase class C family) [Geodermatophilus sabuli]SNX98658.1 CubicO group peptidase, beta-lactamase class C family [Geodermatophilus sabuli]